MFGETDATCETCGAQYSGGCVSTGECPDCESKRMILEHAGWKIKQVSFPGLDEATWEDPKSPGTICKQSQALLLQEGRMIEQIKRLSK